MQIPEQSIAERLGRGIRRTRTREYWLVLLVTAAVGAGVMVLLPTRAERPVLCRPVVPRSDYLLFKVSDVSGSGIERLNLSVLVRPGLPNETLAAALNWAVYSALDEYNRQKRRRVRVIWAYAVEDSGLPLARWRAMAIWADPKLPQSRQPARSGGDAVRSGAIEYDFTNPVP